ncbi:MAG: hypothetical protein K6G50_06880 [bacterium]|nr:hypothetical protein [bacterium]
MRYDWWPIEDFRYNNYTLLTPENICQHFDETLADYNDLEDYDENYAEPEILNDMFEFSEETFSSFNIDSLINQWISKFTDLGYLISYESIKPLIENLRIDEKRHLIVETPKGFIQFKARRFKESERGSYFNALSYEILPKLEVK